MSGYTIRMTETTTQHTDTPCFDVIILGAGAAGMYCAMTAAKRGKRVCLIDHAQKPGRKLAVTGGGKCNITNRHISPSDYAGENPDFCRSALSKLTPQALLEVLQSAKIPLEEREYTQIFCERSAKDAIHFLVKGCTSAGCLFQLDERILSAKQEQQQNNDATFTITTSKNTYYARKLVIATGGPAWPQVGATGIGYELARGFGHRIVTIRPALSGLLLPSGSAFTELSGISLPVSISLETNSPAKGKKRNSPKTVAENLPLLFTHKGLSGPAALQASLYWSNRKPLSIDFLPGRNVLSLLNEAGIGKQLCKHVLRRLLPERLCGILIPEQIASQKVAELNKEARSTINENLHSYSLVPTGVDGFAKAEVTAGGVSTEDISSRSMESRLVPGLYFCGEVLDVTGRLGGYNLHWAFASGYAAGNAIE